MLHKETVTAGTLEILKELMLDERLADFFLVGGTALSLRIGHRTSLDIDLFSDNVFNAAEMLEYLETEKAFKLDYLNNNTIKGQISSTKVDFITHAYPLVKKLENIEGVRIAGLEDIAAMKLNAIVENGTRLKDYIDVAFLSCYMSLKTMIEAYEYKYMSRNPFIILKALAYHNDINFEEPVQMTGKKLLWKSIKKRLDAMEKFPSKTFETSPDI